MNVTDLPTPALVLDADAFEHNLAAMADLLPGPRLRPHVKAHKCTGIAAAQARHGHNTFTCATPREMVGHGRRPGWARTSCWPTRPSTRPGWPPWPPRSRLVRTSG